MSALDRYVRAGKWLQGNAPFTDRVWGEPIGIVGLGAIGRAVARRAEGFGMDIAYYGRHWQAGRALPLRRRPRASSRAT